MVLGALVSGLVLALIAVLAGRRGRRVGALAWAGLVWSLIVIALVTLVPLDGIDLTRPAASAQGSCSLDYGGPAPDGFWIFAGTQRMLNTVLFVPAGATLVVALTRRRIGWLLVPLGLAALAGYSLAIELTQLELARIGRACDITDIVDNISGALIGAAIGLVISLVVGVSRRRG